MDVSQLTYLGTLTAAPRNQLSAVRPDRDRELLEALRRREPTAGERLVASYGDRAYRLAIRITGNAPDAEEAVQDAFWSVVRKIDTFRSDSALGSWIYRIVANAAYQKCVAERTDVPTSRWTRLSRDSTRMGGTPI